jgi:hypothetical protein
MTYQVTFHPGHASNPERSLEEYPQPVDVSYVLDAGGEEVCTVYSDDSEKMAEKIAAALTAFDEAVEAAVAAAKPRVESNQVTEQK